MKPPSLCPLHDLHAWALCLSHKVCICLAPPRLRIPQLIAPPCCPLWGLGVDPPPLHLRRPKFKPPQREGEGVRWPPVGDQEIRMQILLHPPVGPRFPMLRDL